MTSVVGRFCCKTPKMPFDQFPANRPNEPRSPIDVAVRPLPRSPVSSSLDNVVPQSIVRSPRARPGEFGFSHAKRLLQQNLEKTGSDRRTVKVTRMTHNGSVPHAWSVLTTKVAFVPALRAGQETSRAATQPRSERDAVEPFRVYWRPTDRWARSASKLRMTRY